MSRPKDLPGFYYDEVKNRYFPIKGPIPGSSSSSASRKASSLAPKTPAAVIKSQCRASTTSSLLRARELGGNVFPLRKRKCRFENEFLNVQVSQPQVCHTKPDNVSGGVSNKTFGYESYEVWRYDETFNVADTALDDLTVDIITPQGQARTAALLTGSTNGRLSFFAVGTGGDYFDSECMSRQIWPRKKVSEKCSTSTPPVHLWRPLESSIQLSSDISCIRSLNKRHSETETTSSANRALITTLGSHRYGGIVYVINLGEPLDFHLRIGFGHINEVASFNSTIWTSDCSATKNQAVMGTSSGAALVNLENGAISWVCRTESDVFAQQFDQSGNIVLCGLRNGAILTVDIREDQRVSSSTSPRLPRHRIPYTPSNKIAANSSKKWFKMSGKIYPSSTTFMPNSVASLISLQLYDQYFLASSMDGSIKLYDHRLVSRGPVQSYEGHVNTHTRLQLGVDPYERFVVAGGEDRSMRLWSIKSGKLLFEDKLFSADPVTMCCQIAGDGTRSSNLDNSWGSWHGSREGLFYTRWC